MIVTENQFDEWVRGNARDAQGVVVELVWRLVAASSPGPKERRFPLGDSIGQPGPDGVLDAEFAFEPFVPEGRSFWEIGTGVNAGAKATSDYGNLSAATPEDVRRESAFVFVTPLSGRRDWPHTWKEDAQAAWLEERRRQRSWRDVRVVDGTRLVDWLHSFPSVELWLAQKMGMAVEQIDTPEQRWTLLASIGAPPPLPPKVFLVNREAASAKLKEIFAGTNLQLKLDTHFPDQIVDFVCAYIASMDEDARIDAASRCLIVSGSDAWTQLASHRERHVLVAEFDLDDVDGPSTKLLERARRAGHGVVFAGKPGGIPHPNREAVPNPKAQQIKEVLEASGYTEERARILAQKSGGNVSSLLRCLQNLSLMPEWAEGTAAGDLAIAELLGSWDEGSAADCQRIEGLSGNLYGEWIGRMREVALRPGTPLTQRDGVWRMVARYEGWYALGPRLFDEHLERLRTVAVAVLRERDPKFELPPDERFAASIHGKVLLHSSQLRTGLAEGLALLGSHPKALTSCTFGRAESTARLAVRVILANADWILWSSLNAVLPLLAEAAPREFLEAVELALASDPCPFDVMFGQEGSGVTGTNYMTGVLWALETLAWDPAYLTRVIVLLGELAARDPGGNWGNRPSNSLSTILLPWLPQTCATLEKRTGAVTTLLNEQPEVAWRVLLALLPDSQQSSFGSRKPAWREIIPDDWSKGVTVGEYWEQVRGYVALAIEAAKSDVSRLADLIGRLDHLPEPAREALLEHLVSEQVRSLPDGEKLRLWMELADLIARHRKFVGADWAMPVEEVEKIAAVAQKLEPSRPALRHRRLFSERDLDLYEEQGNYDEQMAELERRRQTVTKEILGAGGIQAVVEFARSVEAPWRAGIAFGIVAPDDADSSLLPDLLESSEKADVQFVGGFVWGRFRTHGWSWVDKVNTSAWTQSQKGIFLAYLPFSAATWERVARILREDEAPYWTRTNANAYEVEVGIEHAVDKLIENGRPRAAIRCLQVMRRKKVFDSVRATRALLAALDSTENAHSTDAHEITEIIKTLQSDPGTDPDSLFQVEWAYLPLLDRHRGGVSPRLIERRLANEPKLFCELVRLVFRSRKDPSTTEAVDEKRKAVAANAYRLLSGWRTPPGSRTDATYDGDALRRWIEDVRTECGETGHLEVAMTMTGHALVYAPPDPDGLWIHRSVAAALNARDAEDMRAGFKTELFNMRGVHAFTSGQEERTLAAKYQGQAEAVEAGGFHRLAGALREVAKSYEHDAERHRR